MDDLGGLGGTQDEEFTQETASTATSSQPRKRARSDLDSEYLHGSAAAAPEFVSPKAKAEKQKQAMAAKSKTLQRQVTMQRREIHTTSPIVALVEAAKAEIHAGWKGPSLMLSEVVAGGPPQQARGGGHGSAEGAGSSAAAAAPAAGSSSMPAPPGATPTTHINHHIALLFAHAPALTRLVCVLLGVCQPDDSPAQACHNAQDMELRDKAYLYNVVSVLIRWRVQNNPTPLTRSLSVMMYSHHVPDVVFNALSALHVTTSANTVRADVQHKLVREFEANRQKCYVLVYDNINIRLIPKLYRGGAISEELTGFVRSILTPADDYTFTLIDDIWSHEVCNPFTHHLSFLVGRPSATHRRLSAARWQQAATVGTWAAREKTEKSGSK